MVEPAVPDSREIWQLVEPLHAVIYFAPACVDSMAELGLKGFWMGYFAGRAAPLGAANASTVEASFYNFSPTRVRRAIPDAWSFAAPADVVATRSSAAAIALRQVRVDVDETTRRALPLLESAAAAARCDGRILAAANQQVPSPADPVARLWQACTTLREHRGDGHVAALVSCDLGGIEALVLASTAAPGAAGAERLQAARGWTPDEWAEAQDRLRSRGLLDEDGIATDAGYLLHARVEQITDDIAAQPYRDGLTAAGLDLLRTVLKPFVAAIHRSEVIPFPNPIGLPAPAERSADAP